MTIHKETAQLDNTNPFHRDKGTRCGVCGKTEETLWVYNNAVYVLCAECQTPKGKEPFKKRI
jgi:hypothetical protein